MKCALHSTTCRTLSLPTPDIPTCRPIRRATRRPLRRAEVLARAGMSDHGVTLSVTKGLPLSGGQGGSAASAIAAAVAVNVLVGDSGNDMLDTHALLSAALVAESTEPGGISTTLRHRSWVEFAGSQHRSSRRVTRASEHGVVDCDRASGCRGAYRGCARGVATICAAIHAHRATGQRRSPGLGIRDW